ncbi:MAG: hypothetical protein AB7E51_18920 [Pseudodesulfovibrio sp.]|uniref:hypothetical protein n=1 Tax=Pseudodesulfovibrio sp. TaxID=2035812 RepID=UPI003D11FBEC
MPGIETTATTALLHEGHIYRAHVGDSRLYRGRLTQIITDHTSLRELVEHGDMTAVEAAPHPLRNMLDQRMDAKAACRSTASPAWSPTIGCALLGWTAP